MSVPIEPARPAMPAATATPPVSRAGLGRLATGLVAYGAIGLAIAVVGLVALLYAGQRIGGLAERTSAQVESIITTLDRTATVLDDAGATAVSFAATLERMPPIVDQAATTIGSLQANLRGIEAQLASFAILGSTPLAGTAERFGQIADDLDGLDTRLGLLASDLDHNKERLLANAASLRALGAQLSVLADDLREGVIEDSLADVQFLLTVLFGLLVAWTAVPAAGALGVGIWLRRELRRSGGA